MALLNIRGCNGLIRELGERFRKPILINSVAGLSGAGGVAGLSASPLKLEAHGFYLWKDYAYRINIMHARKVIQNTQILCATRFGSPISFSSPDTLNSHIHVTAKLGTRFRYINIHELIDQMTPAVEGGNPTTPGRITPDLAPEDQAEAERICDELIKGAVDVRMTRENILPSVIAFVMVRKHMCLNDCNAFAMPCPDACSTRRLNEGKFTMCLTHALNMEAGIASACEYDTSAALSEQALIAVSGKRTYMGNTSPIAIDENGTFAPRFGTTPEQLAKLAENPDNVYFMQHSIAHRRIADPEKDAPYAIGNFAYDQKFGATIRYDFDVDAGTRVTLCRFSPDAEKMFIGSGEIIMGAGYDAPNCTQGVFFRVKDQKETWEAQCCAGNHVSMVYGDYTQELIDLAKSLDVEPVVAR